MIIVFSFLLFASIFAFAILARLLHIHTYLLTCRCLCVAVLLHTLLLCKFATKVLVSKCSTMAITASKVAAAANDFVTFVFTVYTHSYICTILATKPAHFHAVFSAFFCSAQLFAMAIFYKRFLADCCTCRSHICQL